MCPECDYDESTVGDWFVYSEANDNQGGAALVCCPSCDAVLGGAGYAGGY